MRSNHFFLGAMFAVGVNMFIQDIYGLDRYIVHLRADWITLSPWWGFSIAAVALIFSVLTSWMDDEKARLAAKIAELENKE